MTSHRGRHRSTAGTSTPVTEHEQWRLQAACRGLDTELFYPEGRGRKLDLAREAAKQFCRDQCPVIEQCRDAARTERYGIWGGLDEADRGYDPSGHRRKAVAS